MFGKLDGRVGIFPADYVEPMSRNKSRQVMILIFIPRFYMRKTVVTHLYIDNICCADAFRIKVVCVYFFWYILTVLRTG